MAAVDPLVLAVGGLLILIVVGVLVFLPSGGKAKFLKGAKERQQLEGGEKGFISHDTVRLRFVLPKATPVLGLPIGEVMTRLAAAEALGRDAAAKGLADWQTRLDAARTARKKSEAACKQATDASRALEAACAALRGAAQTAHQLVEEERRLRKGAEDQVKRLAARAQAAAKLSLIHISEPTRPY